MLASSHHTHEICPNCWGGISPDAEERDKCKCKERKMEKMEKIKKTIISVEAELSETIQDCIIDCLVLSYRENCMVELTHTYNNSQVPFVVTPVMLSDLLDDIMKSEA